MNTEQFTEQFLAKQRQVLLAIRERLLGRKVVNDHGGNVGDDFGDVSAVISAMENSMSLVSNSRQTLVDVNAALIKLDKGGYGLCESTNEPINVERLEAIPWARFSIAVQSQLEKDRRGYARNTGYSGLFDDSMKSSEEDGEPEEVADA